MDQGAAERRERIRQEAARWVVRLSDPRHQGDRAAFEAWRGASLEHEVAYEREAAAWERLDRVGALRTAHADPDLPLDSLQPAQSQAGPRAPRRSAARRWAPLAASLLILLTGAAAAVWTLSAAPAYATAIGERRLVLLPDGTSVELNTDSKIVVRYAHGRRLVQLLRGEAMFHIARDQRPFLVQTAAARLDARSTDLSVRLAGDAAKVMVKDGIVLAANPDGGAASPVLASVGPQAEAVLGPDGAHVRKVSLDQVDRDLAWRQGAIALNGKTLGEAVQEFNRYNTRRIVIRDSATGAISVGGYFKTSDIDGFVTAVTRTFPVRASSGAQGEIVLSRAG